MATNSAVPRVADADFDNAKTMLHDLFEIMGIQNVVVVDDQLSTPLDFQRIAGAIRARVASAEEGFDLRIPEFAAIDVTFPVEVWRPKVEALWNALDIERKDAIGRALGVVGEAESNESERHVLARILGDTKPEFLSLTQWRQRKDELIDAVTRGATLFLFDQDMTENSGRPDEGMTIIADLLKNHCQDGPAYFGLFSNTLGTNEEYECHLKFIEEHSLHNMEDRFAVISKKGLDTRPRELACRLKRVAISPRCSALKNGVFSAVGDAMEAAKEGIERLHIYDFEHIVFRSSYNEGVWEVDTLLRLFGAFFREAARAKAATDPVIRKAADDVRKVVLFPYRPDDAPEAKVRKVARLEMYETSEYLLTHRIPIELGDIFKKTVGKSLFMLLEQPCDLMVRGGEKNKGTRRVEYVTLAEVIHIKEGKAPPNASAKLEFYSQEPGKEAYVRLEKCTTVPACVLDLCVCSEDGAATLEVDKPCPDKMIPAWQERYRLLQEQAKDILSRYQGLIKPKGREAPSITPAIDNMLQTILLQWVPGLMTGKLDLAAKRIEYTLQRVGKLRQPWSGGVLRDYAYHMARDAFEHDWTRTEQE